MSDEILKRDQNFVTVLAGVTDDSDQDVTMLRVDPITKRLLVATTGGGGGFTLLPATGTIDGSNQTFTFTQQPTYIVSDHAWYKAVNAGPTAGATTNWTWSVLTATLLIPGPIEDIFGVA